MNWWQCPRCGARLRFTSGRAWCARPTCLYDVVLPKPRSDDDTDGF